MILSPPTKHCVRVIEFSSSSAGNCGCRRTEPMSESGMRTESGEVLSPVSESGIGTENEKGLTRTSEIKTGTEFEECSGHSEVDFRATQMRKVKTLSRGLLGTLLQQSLR
ncbi:hypothetical protein PIB30_028092 [Stylosanthes scabra]|uniref:Uncharacterized protein n=1 Tax=Stylosanthes scabra TaxID=79078 RepID=A0ABU6TAI8_9FABA|nr:hypothetical protein [Stylosanthes scabra]